MKIKIAAVLAATVCALIVAGQTLYGKLTKESGTVSTDNAATSQTQSAAYVLKTYGGKLAVFINGSNEPAEVFSVPVSSLPEADRILLEQGIAAFSRAELLRLIEDYTG